MRVRKVFNDYAASHLPGVLLGLVDGERANDRNWASRPLDILEGGMVFEGSQLWLFGVSCRKLFLSFP